MDIAKDAIVKLKDGLVGESNVYFKAAAKVVSVSRSGNVELDFSITPKCAQIIERGDITPTVTVSQNSVVLIR